MPTAGWPSATALATTSGIRAAPSSIEYSVWRCRWTNDRDDTLTLLGRSRQDDHGEDDHGGGGGRLGDGPPQGCGGACGGNDTRVVRTYRIAPRPARSGTS